MEFVCFMTKIVKVDRHNDGPEVRETDGKV